MHIDDWVNIPADSRLEAYAKWFLYIRRMPAYQQAQFREFYGDLKLFCTYRGEVYRCTGASRMGDIYLTSDLDQERGYTLRGVNVQDCTDWSSEPPNPLVDEANNRVNFK